MSLKIAKGLTLPIDAATQTFAIMAMRGVGKTHTASVFAEELLKVGQPIVVYDPTGAWWGLKSSATGKSAGFPVVVFGGDHADVPLTEHSGDVIATTIVERRIPAILDCSLMRKGSRVRFMTDFCETLYHKNREALHFICDEAHTIAPQKAFPEVARLLGAMEDIVLQGRKRGLGATIISQRPALVNKNVLTQCAVLIAMRIVGPHDRKAIEEWIDAHGDRKQAQELLSSLAHLDIGEGWIWSPGWLELFQRVKFRKRETFDSSATPQVGVKVEGPSKLASVDLQALGDAIQATVEQVKANDPAALKRKIVELHKQLTNQEPAVDDAAIERAVSSAVAERDRHWRGEIGQLEKALTDRDRRLQKIEELAHLNGAATIAISEPPTVHRPVQKHRVERQPHQRQPIQRTTEPTDDRLRPAHQRILDALAWLGTMGIDRPSRSIIAAVAGVSPKSSSYSNDVSRLSALGLIRYPAQGLIELTREGKEFARLPESPPSLGELHQAWRSCPALRPAHVRLLDVLIEIYPRELTREELAEAVGVSPKSSSFSNDVSRLSAMGLAEYPQQGYVRAGEELLFPPQLV